MHKWIGNDECSQCLYCGLAVDDDVDSLLVPPCYGSEIASYHHLVASPDGASCAICGMGIGWHTEWSELPVRCVEV
mgnify:CR=1 FL=1